MLTEIVAADPFDTRDRGRPRALSIGSDSTADKLDHDAWASMPADGQLDGRVRVCHAQVAVEHRRSIAPGMPSAMLIRSAGRSRPGTFQPLTNLTIVQARQGRYTARLAPVSRAPSPR